jgi:hypothetical protein
MKSSAPALMLRPLREYCPCSGRYVTELHSILFEPVVRQYFEGIHHPARLRVGEHDVREGAADIDADQVHTVLILPGRRPSHSFPGGGALQ